MMCVFFKIQLSLIVPDRKWLLYHLPQFLSLGLLIVISWLLAMTLRKISPINCDNNETFLPCVKNQKYAEKTTKSRDIKTSENVCTSG